MVLLKLPRVLLTKYSGPSKFDIILNQCDTVCATAVTCNFDTMFDGHLVRIA